jgi:hypothetical protein
MSTRDRDCIAGLKLTRGRFIRAQEARPHVIVSSRESDLQRGRLRSSKVIVLSRDSDLRRARLRSSRL